MKKFDNYRANLEVLCRAYQEDLENEFIVSGLILSKQMISGRPAARKSSL